MKIVVIGGSGRIGAKVVDRLRGQGHEVLAASPSMGVDTVTGAGLAAALAGAQVVVDLANSPSFEARAALEFFQAAGRNLLAAEAAAGVGHHVALSVVGTDRLQENGYFRAKLAQERLIEAGPIPWTIIRSTQFFEFLDGIIQDGTGGQDETGGQAIRLPAAQFQPIAAEDVAAMVAEVALRPPANRMIEIAGPERIGLATLAGRYLAAKGDARRVVADPAAGYFGAAIDDRSLTPGEGAWLGPTCFEDWLRSSAPSAGPQR
jgi:uncharacterized protein YbjT (DUF2867 family)